MLNILGVSTEQLKNDKVVETASGYILDKVKVLAENMAAERPTCPGDPNPLSKKSKKNLKIEPLPIPTTLEQFELDEYDDPIGKKYKTVFLGFSLMTTSIFFAVLAAILYTFWLRFHAN
jgi:hypothetical protein